MKTLIVGKGEVGSSLYEVLKQKHEAYIRDVDPIEITEIEVLNICFPFSETFKEAVKAYQSEYNPALTIIHSTVPPGTSRHLNSVHSPIHGVHPHLAKSIKTFVKYIGGCEKDKVSLAKTFLEDAGIKTKIVSSPEASELSKILCTTQYGLNIMAMIEIKKICDKFDVPFEEVYGWNKLYNKGYSDLGMDQYKRYELQYKGNNIGGHCVMQNANLFACYLTKILKDYKHEFVIEYH